MPKKISIVEARRDLGRLAEEVRRTRRPVILTKRGRIVARITPEPIGSSAARKADSDSFAGLRGTVQVIGSLGEVERTIRSLRREFGRSLDRRAALMVSKMRRNA